MSRSEESEAIVARGWEVYNASVRQHMKPSDVGDMVLVDLDTGEFWRVSGYPLWKLTAKIRSRRPEARLFGVNVGFLGKDANGDPIPDPLGPTLSPEEVTAREERAETGRRGWEIYNTWIRPLMKPEDIGKMLHIDVDSGDYELMIDRGRHRRTDAVRERRPYARILGIRVGFKAVVTFGGGLAIDPGWPREVGQADEPGRAGG